MMESNYPVDSRSAGYIPAWNAMKIIVKAATYSEKNALFSGNAARVYRLNLKDFNQ